MLIGLKCNKLFNKRGYKSVAPVSYTHLDVYKRQAYESDNRTELRGYDVAALKHTTQNLGHNRLDVVIYNYLGAKN